MQLTCNSATQLQVDSVDQALQVAAIRFCHENAYRIRRVTLLCIFLHKSGNVVKIRNPYA